ncbi:M23 family metallopeptidase [Antrihabitans spumae]|uniref:M23 family metallopeptidase n=1 Tax=Antrihabitans spumae TaxID=3373370 RepID=A0ABW7JZL5_9NOCA
MRSDTDWSLPGAQPSCVLTDARSTASAGLDNPDPLSWRAPARVLICSHPRSRARAPWERVEHFGFPTTHTQIRTAAYPTSSKPGLTSPAATTPSGIASRPGGAHRQREQTRYRSHMIAVSVAVGAVFAAGATSTSRLPADNQAGADTGEIDIAPNLLNTVRPTDPSRLLNQLASARQREQDSAAREAAARRPKSVMPTSGTLTSAYGARWGTVHNGLDIANVIGTPVLSTSDGQVIEAGPADGFGLWVRVRQDDGTIGVYGHINEALVEAGQLVKAGQQIATMGNRGQSTGPHLHYEVWMADGTKDDPGRWLRDRGVPMSTTTISTN